MKRPSTPSLGKRAGHMLRTFCGIMLWGVAGALVIITILLLALAKGAAVAAERMAP